MQYKQTRDLKLTSLLLIIYAVLVGVTLLSGLSPALSIGMAFPIAWYIVNALAKYGAIKVTFDGADLHVTGGRGSNTLLASTIANITFHRALPQGKGFDFNTFLITDQKGVATSIYKNGWNAPSFLDDFQQWVTKTGLTLDQKTSNQLRP